MMKGREFKKRENKKDTGQARCREGPDEGDNKVRKKGDN